MANHPSSGWRRTVGPQWSSVKRQEPGSGLPPGMHQGFHSSYLNAISRPDLDPDLLRQQQQQQQQQQQPSLSSQSSSTTSQSSSTTSQSTNHSIATNDVAPLADTPNEYQRAFLQYQENQRQQQLYLQQLELMQRLQAMPGSTTRPWYPTFGPAITTSCSDSTIQLDNPNQFTLINNAKLNRHAVGPHWRSIQTSATYSPTPSPPASSPLLHSRTVAPSSLSSRLSTASTTTALHAYLSSTYSSAASIDYARATSFHQYDQIMTENKGTQQQPSHQEYYQSHSYPHDPRHHSLQSNQPSNSREARENMLVTNRLFLTPNTTSATSHTGKRRATWRDEDDESDEDKNDSNSSRAMREFSSSENVSHPLTEQSSVQQFVPTTVFKEQGTIIESGAPVNQDQEMRSAEKRLSTQSTTSSCVDRDVESMDQDDMEVVAETTSTVEDRIVDTPQPRQVKRSKQRLDWTVYGIESVAEARRLQSGEQVKDIFQECFYNAAASTSQ